MDKQKTQRIPFDTETIYRKNADGCLEPLQVTVIEDRLEEDVEADCENMWFASATNTLGQKSPRMLLVAQYILENRDKDTNCLNATRKEIAASCGVTVSIVGTTLHILASAGLVISKPGAYKVNLNKFACSDNAVLHIYH